MGFPRAGNRVQAPSGKPVTAFKRESNAAPPGDAQA
jgi:hypothetical protein